MNEKEQAQLNRIECKIYDVDHRLTKIESGISLAKWVIGGLITLAGSGAVVFVVKVCMVAPHGAN